MADYKVHLGVKLNTGDINEQINKYKAKPIDIKAKLNLADIKSQLQSYKAEIEVQTKLNTTGLAKKIGEYQPKTPVTLRAELNTSDIDTKISGYKAKPIEVGVKLKTSDIKEQLKNYKTNETIEVDAKLNDKGIDNAIRNYTPKSRIKVRLTLNASDVEEALKDYTPSQPLKIRIKIDRADVNAQLKQYKADHDDAFIKVKAKLDNDAITQAIKNYKALTPIKLALTLDYSDIENKINAYRAKAPVDLPVNMKLNVKDVGAQLKQHKLTVPVELLVGNINIADIDNKLASYKATTPIKVGIKLDNSDIGTQIKNYKINTPLKIAAQLDTSSIDDQIKGYVTPTPIKVAVKLDSSEINEEIRNVGLGKSINMKLDREKINEQIKNLTIKSKAKVGVKLDFVGIPKQISDYKTKSKIKVGVRLDKDDIAQEISTIKTDTPIKLGVELDPEGIQNIKGQIKNIKQQIEALGNIKINLGGSTIGATTGAATTSTTSAGASVGTQVARDLIEADIQIENTKEDVQALRKVLGQIGFEASAIDSLTKDFDSLDVAVKRVTTRLYKDGTMTLTINGVDEAKRAVTSIYDVVGKNDVTLLSKKITQSLGESERFIQQRKRAIADLTNQINQANRAAIDPNTSRPIKDSAHLDSLKSKYTEIILAIEAMGNASSDTFEDERNKVKALISEYKSLKSEYKNAENVTLEWDGNDFASGLEIAKNKLAAFKREAKDFPQMAQTVKELDSAIENVGDASSLTTFTNQLDVAQSALKNIKAEANEAYKALTDAWKKIDSLSTQTARLNPETNPRQLAELSAQLEEAEADYESLKKAFGSKLSTSQFGTLQANADDLANKLDAIEKKHQDTRAELAKKISIHLEAGKFTTQVEQISSGVKNLSGDLPELEVKLKTLKNAKQVLDTAFSSGSIDEQIAAYRQYLKALAEVENQLKQNQIQERDTAREQKLELSKKGLSSDMTSWLRENSIAAKKFGDEVRRLQAQLETCDNSVDFDNIKRQFRNVQKEAKSLGLTGLTTFDKLKYKLKEYMAYFSVAQVFMYAERGLRSMFEQVKLIDSAMTELKKVTNETDAVYNKFLSNAAKRSKEIGTTIDGLVSSTADFARLGYGFEDAQGLAEVANIYAVVGDEIEGVEGATQSLISTMAAFKGEMNGMSNTDFAMSIIDKFNEIGNNFSISSGGIGEALERSASSLMAANNTIDESIALITAANTVVQSPDAVGTAFKTKNLNCLYVQKCA